MSLVHPEMIKVGDVISRSVPGSAGMRREGGRVIRIETQTHYYGGQTLMAYHFWTEVPAPLPFRPNRVKRGPCISHNWEGQTIIEVTT